MNEWENWHNHGEGLGLPGIGGLEPSETLADGLTIDLGGVSYDLPAPVTGDDLVEESVTLTDDSGMTICSDTDGDGLVDYMSVVTFDGGWSAWRREASMTDSAGSSDITGGVDPAEDDAPGKGPSGVSSITSGASELGSEPSETLQVEVTIGSDGASDVPPTTPENGTGIWNAVGWKCVERGRWG
ncbi:MAG TPA: hypothetical protein H9870_04880 [Candidatus Corynebacterium avicola]|uniref:DUF6802 domain-containing protein n=1 Tax=Candidatus Corynebacterium avicola TaxID=2838527 RepID=A0A9D1RMD7_9CORY|nr:hypothetical protein [Candidatus Corynebacterium avicola]